MLTTEPTKEMLQEWKNLHKQYRPLLSPNRRSGAQVDAYFRNTYPHTLLDSEELREMIAAEILENPHHAEKLPPESMPDVHCYMTENVLVGIDLVTGHIHVECEEITKSVQIYDALFVYRGLDEADLENAFLTAEYVRLAQEAYGDGFLTEDGICQRTQD